MSQEKDDDPKGSHGYQKKSTEEVDEIVTRLNTPKKKYEPKNPDRSRKVERKMTKDDITAMVERLHSAKPRERRKSAYEQGGVFSTYACNGWHTPGSGGKHYDVY